ncbi:MAG: ATP-grasp fold amidoligase family protein [Anaerolineales bacterium]
MKSTLKKIARHALTRLKWIWIDLADLFYINPRDFSWKVRWRMKNDRNPLYVELQDKYKVKAYAHKKSVQTADVYFVTDNPETIPFDSLPEKYFIKANHGSGWNILFEDGQFFNYVNGENLVSRDLSKSVINRDECVELCKIWLRTPYSKRQWAYGQIKPLIYIEEKVEPYEGTALIDYRCFVFNGVVRVINQDSPDYDMHTNVFVDPSWKPFDLPGHTETPPTPFPKNPSRFSDIVKTAETLGNGFDFVRVDLFDTTKGILLSEMTIYPEGGNLNTPTSCSKFNKWLAEQWTLPIVRKAIFS